MTTEQITVQIETESYDAYNVEVEVHFFLDLNWGADADGNEDPRLG